MTFNGGDMIDKNTNLQVIGTLMKKPRTLANTDKYNLTPLDFHTKFERYIFIAIDGLFQQGAMNISAIDVENYLDTNDSAKATFNSNNGIEYLQDALSLAEPDNFSYYYNKMKKFNLLMDLDKQGIDIKEFYNTDFLDPSAIETNKKFEELEITDIITSIKRRVLKVESNFLKTDVSETQTAFEGMADLLESLEAGEGIGLPMQGEILNEVVMGARKGAFYVRSAASGVGKTRNMVGDACQLAYPFRYSNSKQEWVQEGFNEKILFIATEQNFGEIRKMILAYLTGINESKFTYMRLSPTERKIMNQALWIMKQYEDNFLITRMPDPTIELVKVLVRENCLFHGVEYVFYDYVFVGPALLGEFKGIALRNDEALLMFSTALKDLAVELDIFVMSATQVNAKADNNEQIRNEGSIAGARSIINKADVGMIMARPTNEELDILQQIGNVCGILPNTVTDVYKVRAGRYTQVRIWSYVDLGIMRKKDLFMTDSRFEPVECDITPVIHGWDSESEGELQSKMKELVMVA